MNMMCGMSQFDVVVLIPGETPAASAANFIQHVLVNFFIFVVLLL